MKHRAGWLVLAGVLLLPHLTLAQQPNVRIKSAPRAPAGALTPASRAAIERQVRAEVERMMASARVADAEGLLRNTAKQDGLCLFGLAGAVATPCSQVWAALRQGWSGNAPDREARQEFDGLEIKAMALSPTVAIATMSAVEDRAYGATGQLLVRAPLADLFVFVLEDGQWRLHSAQQAVWLRPTGLPALEPERKVAIEQQVRTVLDSVWAADARADASAAFAHAAKGGDGLCQFGRKTTACANVWAGFRRAWSDENPNRVLRQEFDGMDNQVMALTPTVAVFSTTVEEGRAYLKSGQVSRGRYGLFGVFVLEDGKWRLHSAQQSAWPLPPIAAAASSGAGTSKPCDVQGVWEYISGEEDGALAPPVVRQRKIITRGHWAWVRGEKGSAKPPATQADSIALLQFHLGGAGSYTVHDSTYTEKIELFADRAYEGMSIPFTCRVVGDRLYQSGTYPILQNGKKVRDVRMQEVYRRIE